MFPLVIQDALLVDGTGAEPRRASVGVRDGRVAAVAAGPLDGAEVVEADGRVLAPGFIDLHSHADFSVEESPAASTQLAQGVTSLVTGNCGMSPFPVADLDEMKRSSAFLRSPMSWSWRDLGGFREVVDGRRPGVNLAAQVGHGALRAAVVGNADRAPSPDELSAMGDLLRAAADQGAVGFSTGLIYAPGSYADPAEVHALARVAAERGLLYSTHVRGETDHVLAAIDEAIETARRTGVRLEISHIKAMGPRNHGKVADICDRLDAVRAEGLDVAADVYPYTASSTSLASRLPDWAMDGGVPALLERLADPDAYAQLRSALAERFSGEIDPAGVVLATLGEGAYADRVGSSLVDVAEATGSDPARVALDVLRAHRGNVSVINHQMHADDLDRALAHPMVSVASDGWVLALGGPGMPHPRSFGTFARVLARFVRERGLLTLQEAVRKMTSLPASRLGWDDRGCVREGAYADLVLLAPDRVADRSTFDDPWHEATGVDAVWVGGEQAWRDGRVTDARAGRLL